MGSARFDGIFDLSRYKADAMITCPCGRKASVPARDMVRVFGAISIRAAEKRLLCSLCGEKRATITPVPAARR